MKNQARAITAVWIALVTAACSDERVAAPAESGIEPAFGVKGAPAAPPGTLQLCKVAGAGVTAGDPFDFAISLSGVVRSTTLGAGSCLEIAVPRDGAPQTKGYYQRKTGDVEGLVPDGAALLVDAAALTNDQLIAILQDGSGVQASSSLVLNLAQQLITADLNILRGVQPSANVLQAIADANGAIQIDPGPPISVTSSLDASSISALVDVLAAFNEGRPKPPAPSPSVSLDITETIPPLTEIASITCNPVIACAGADPATGGVTATVTSGQTTTVSYENRLQTLLRICKEAGTGIAAGTEYHFSAGGINVFDAGSADVPAGDCADLALQAGTYMVLEAVPAGNAVSAITCDPATRCANASLPFGQVHATVVNGLTTVTFTNRSTIGIMKVCKSAGPGLVDGMPFSFTAGGINVTAFGTVTVNTGDCGTMSLEEGSYLVLEAPVPDTKVSGIGCFPGPRCTNLSLSGASLHAAVVGGDTTHVSFTNSTTIGTLEVCKSAGSGVTPGTVFRFTAGGINVNEAETFDVPADDCRQIALTEGDYLLAESTVPAVRVSGIGCFPGHLCSNINLQAGQLQVTIVANQTTHASFTNSSTIGTLRVCKVAGTGITAGSLFQFVAGGINVAHAANIGVLAGDCTNTTVPEGQYMLSEIVPPGVQVTDITCTAGFCSNTNPAIGTTNVGVLGGRLTTVTFTNAVAN